MLNSNFGFNALKTIHRKISNLKFDYYLLSTNNLLIYGSIGTLMIILIWIYLNSIILLTGFELNASINNASVNKEKL